MKARRDIRELQADYDDGKNNPGDNSADKMKPLENLIRAWKGIQELPPDNKHSLFKIAGYHGEPFRGAGWSNPAWWGGYCNHGNVLFPVWHRAYLVELENALQSIKGCGDVTLPYWNETDKATEETGLPKIFLQKKFTLDGEEIPNPLYSYKFQAAIYDNLSPIPDHDYTKPEGYETVRYPFSGLVGPADKDATEAHNNGLIELGEAQVNKYLNENVQSWLGFSVTNSDGHIIYTGTRIKYEKCLDAPNYTVFSNTTSAMQWNEDHFGVEAFKEEGAPNAAPEAVVPLESPHNAMHLAIGGFEMPGVNYDKIEKANGDMGENDTASFDPIFYFHHCFIDKVFWDWQVKWKQTKSLGIIDGYPGTNSVDSQGPTPGVAGNTWLNMDSPLQPFQRFVWTQGDQPQVVMPPGESPQGGLLQGELPQAGLPQGELPLGKWPSGRLPTLVYKTGKEMVDIAKLGYKYEDYKQSGTTESSSALATATTDKLSAIPMHIPTTSSTPLPSPLPSPVPSPPILRIPGINRGNIAGSFLISTWANDKIVDVEPVLSRWHVQECKNCQTHLHVKTFVPLYGWTHDQAKKVTFTVKLHTRDDRAGTVPKSLKDRPLKLGHIGTRA